MTKTEGVRQYIIAEHQAYIFTSVIQMLENSIERGEDVASNVIDGLLVCYSLRDIYERAQTAFGAHLKYLRGAKG